MMMMSDLSPLPVGMANYVSTPSPNTYSLHDSHRSLKTPVKCIGHYYNSQQYCTPNGLGQSWAGLAQSSPFHKTPASVAMGSHNQSSASSQKGNSKMATPFCNGTPKQPYNPFEQQMLEHLEQSIFSPNVFAEVQSASKTPKSFSWTVDELAILKPVEIDEMQLQSDTNGAQSDTELEKRAQDLIDQYFAKNLIAPSPWSEEGRTKPFVLPRTPKTPARHMECSAVEERRHSLDGKQKCSVQDTACQTILSLPVDFNINKVLGEYMTQNERISDENGDSLLSMSSLRRKLFFPNGEENNPPSPVRASEKNGHILESPIRNLHYTPKQSECSLVLTPTPASSQFSSSPISALHSSDPRTPYLRRCSTEPNMMGSPGFSPIGSNHSKHSQASHMTPLCQPLQATPSSERIARPFSSPGMSPIIQPNNSYISTPVLHQAGPRRSCRSEKVLVPFNLLAASEEQEEDSRQAMDIGTDLFRISEEDLSFISCQDDKSSKARRLDLDSTQYSDDDLSSQDTCQTYFVSHASQDTGYNTNSLQLTQDPASHSSLHTNLTQHFGNLPLSGHDTIDMDTCESEPSKKQSKKNIIRHVASKSRLRIIDSDDEVELNDRDVRRKAKQVLGRSISMDDSQLGLSMDFSILKPKLLKVIRGEDKNCVDFQDEQDSSKEDMLPSEVASNALQRAGEDIRRYCMAKSPPLNVQCNFISSTDSHSIRVSTSAEF